MILSIIKINKYQFPKNNNLILKYNTPLTFKKKIIKTSSLKKNLNIHNPKNIIY